MVKIPKRGGWGGGGVRHLGKIPKKFRIFFLRPSLRHVCTWSNTMLLLLFLLMMMVMTMIMMMMRTTMMLAMMTLIKRVCTWSNAANMCYACYDRPTHATTQTPLFSFIVKMMRVMMIMTMMISGWWSSWWKYVLCQVWLSNPHNHPDPSLSFIVRMVMTMMIILFCCYYVWWG